MLATSLPFSRRSQAARVMSRTARVRVQAEPFDLAQEHAALRLGSDGKPMLQIGAIATFLGTVRDLNLGDAVSSLTLEHYPGMTEATIEKILLEAETRWPILALRVVHRVGTLAPGDDIVWVGAASAHREAALASVAFIMDFLKTQAPFWKREAQPTGQARWLDARASDDAAASRWQQP